jgi:plastocyanin
MRSCLSLLAAATLSSVVSALHHEVTVGKGGKLKFDPENLVARPGDKITYRFFAKVSPSSTLQLIARAFNV